MTERAIIGEDGERARADDTDKNEQTRIAADNRRRRSTRPIKASNGRWTVEECVAIQYMKTYFSVAFSPFPCPQVAVVACYREEVPTPCAYGHQPFSVRGSQGCTW